MKQTSSCGHWWIYKSFEVNILPSHLNLVTSVKLFFRTLNQFLISVLWDNSTLLGTVVVRCDITARLGLLITENKGEITAKSPTTWLRAGQTQQREVDDLLYFEWTCVKSRPAITRVGLFKSDGVYIVLKFYILLLAVTKQLN